MNITDLGDLLKDSEFRTWYESNRGKIGFPKKFKEKFGFDWIGRAVEKEPKKEVEEKKEEPKKE